MATSTPPWLFPCSNAGFHLDNGVVSDTSFSSGKPPEDMRIAVFVADPRYLVMKDVLGMRSMGSNYCSEEALDVRTCLEYILGVQTGPGGQGDPGVLPGILGGSINGSCAWAEVEAHYPEQVRLFFIDDFLSAPEVAMASLARFFDVPILSQATQQALRESTRLASIHHYTPNGAGSDIIKELVNIGAHKEHIEDFEAILEHAPSEFRASWERQLGRWLQSPHPRLVAWASGVLQKEPWNPERWWALHSARACRPCLFFPRGKCSDDNCAYCHGAHTKPKRPSKSIRNRRKGRFDRTPSPDSRNDYAQSVVIFVPVVHVPSWQ